MNSTLKRVVLLFVCFICLFVVMAVFFSAEQEDGKKYELSEIDAFLLEATNKLNSRLPMVIDSETRLDNTMGVNNQMRYNFTLVNYTAREANVKEFRDIINQQMENTICSTHKMDVYLEKGISITYAYFGKEGKLFHEKTINPGECGS